MQRRDTTVSDWMDSCSSPGDDKCHEFVLLFDLATGSPRVTYYLIDPEERKLIPKPCVLIWNKLKNLTGYKTLVMDHYLYILGGKHWETGEYIDIVYRYDTRLGTWSERAPLSKPKVRFTADVVWRKIVVTGGEVRGGRLTNVVDIYDPVTDTWTQAPGLPSPRADHASCVVDKKLYISGGTGITKQGASNTFWEFNIQLRTWREANELNTMGEAREKHNMVAFQHRIYVVAGLGLDQTTFRQRDVGLPESYHTVRNDILGKKVIGWKDDYPGMMYPRSGAGVVTVGHRIYVFGGYNTRRSEECRMSEYFHIKKRRWLGSVKLPETSFIQTTAVILKVPKRNTEFSTLTMAVYKNWVLW